MGRGSVVAVGGRGLLGLGIVGLVGACGAVGGVEPAPGPGLFVRTDPIGGVRVARSLLSQDRPDDGGAVGGQGTGGSSKEGEPATEEDGDEPSLDELWAEEDPWGEDGGQQGGELSGAETGSDPRTDVDPGQDPEDDPWADPEEDPWEDGGAGDDPWGDAPEGTEGEPQAAGPWGVGDAGSRIAEQAEAERDPWRGSLMTRYRGRFAGGAEDHDLYEVLTLEYGDAEHDRWTGFFMGQASYDLDGDSDLNDQFVFFSLDDTYDSRLTSELYLAYADYHGAKELDVLRVGRQQVFATPEFAWFDGVYAETTPLGVAAWQGGIYGGIPVYPFESSSDGDAIYGAFLEAKPWRGARWRADWMHLEDENLLGPHRDDLWAVSYRQTLGERLYLRSGISWLEDDARDWSAGLDWVSRDADWLVDVEFRQLLRTQVDRATPFDPFFATLLQQFPASELRVNVSKDFGESVQLQGGFDVRRVEDDGDIGRFNRDFERGYLNLGFYDALPSELQLTLTGEVWDSPQSDVVTWGLDLTKEIDEAWTASAGSAFSLFKYEPYLVDEREDVRTWYVRATHDPRKALRFEFSYELESNDLDDFHILRGGLRWRF